MVVIIYYLADDMSLSQAIQPSPRWGELERGFRRAGEGLSCELERAFRRVGEGLLFLPSVDNLRLLLWISVDNYAFRVAYCV